MYCDEMPTEIYFELIMDNQGNTVSNSANFAFWYENDVDIYLGFDRPADKYIAKPLFQNSVITGADYETAIRYFAANMDQ